LCEKNSRPTCNKRVILSIFFLKNNKKFREQSSLFILFKKNLNYLHERTIVLDLPKYFSELLEAEKNDLQNDIEKVPNISI